LLLGVLTDHLVFVSFHLLLALDKSSLLVHGKDHVSLGLLHLKVLDAGHFTVLTDHTLDDGVNLVTFLQVLVLCLGFKHLTIHDLSLDVVLVIETINFACLL